MSKIAVSKTQIVEKKKNLLNSVSFDSGFHFFIDLGRYTGITANGTVEFAEKIQIIPVQSVNFHFRRQDFQKWFRNTIGDEELAKRIDLIKADSQDEQLRNELSKTVQLRVAELARDQMQTTY